MDDSQQPRSAPGHENRRPPPRRAVLPLLGLLLAVQLSWSLYQLPLNRAVERRLCREYYRENGPEDAINPDGSIDEGLCKVDEVQQGLAWVLGAMETAWIVGGKGVQYSQQVAELIDLTCGRFCHDHSARLRSREVRPEDCPLAEPGSPDLYDRVGPRRGVRRDPPSCVNRRRPYTVSSWRRLRL